MSVAKNTLRVFGALFLIALILFMVDAFTPYLEDDEMIIYNNTSKELTLCAMQQHESDCSTIATKTSESFNLDYVKTLMINKDKAVNLNYHRLPKLFLSEIYCKSKYKCLYAFQIESSDLFYALNSKQKFPVKEYSNQPKGFPLKIHKLGL